MKQKKEDFKRHMNSISIIIPTLNEAETIGHLVTHLFKHSSSLLAEIIVVDGNSTDNTEMIAKEAGASVIRCKKCGRANQMNKGALVATGEILYFVHSDTLPPTSYMGTIHHAVASGFKIGCFRANYNSKNPFLKINSYCTRFQKIWCRGGDQSLFITKYFFKELGGYRQDCLIMEEYELIEKAQQKTTFKILPEEIIISTRKYEQRGYFRIQLASLIAIILYRLGVNEKRLLASYNWWLG